MPKRLDIKPGDRFGRLVVIGEAEKTKHNKRRFLCKCDCGKMTIATVDNLNGGHTRSCGCYCYDIHKARLSKHGGCGTRLYGIWQGMKKRCLNKNNWAYKYYGEQSISLCDEWLVFENFRDWALKNGYTDTLTLERKDVAGNYEPGNCKWIPIGEQNNNKINSRKITFQGKTMTLRDWAKGLNLNYQTLHGRLAHGWSIRNALTAPIGFRGKNNEYKMS